MYTGKTKFTFSLTKFLTLFLDLLYTGNFMTTQESLIHLTNVFGDLAYDTVSGVDQLFVYSVYLRARLSPFFSEMENLTGAWSPPGSDLWRWT